LTVGSVVLLLFLVPLDRSAWGIGLWSEHFLRRPFVSPVVFVLGVLNGVLDEDVRAGQASELIRNDRASLSSEEMREILGRHGRTVVGELEITLKLCLHLLRVPR